tara:strand:- start:1842 stop:3317 length:1476 start_codon:yes stop_codon:yes gene_type:complete
MNSKKNVIVISARRSGTHLLTDLIVNNFGYKSINYNYIDYPKFTDEMEGFESSMNEGGKVTWSHSHDYKDYYKFNHSIDDQNKLDKFFSESKIILAYRDVRDIITSCYHRPRYKSKYKTFDNFYKNFDFDGYELVDQKYDNMFELLLQYYKNWFSVYMAKELLDIDMEVISFEEIIEDYDSSLNKIGKFLEQSPKGVDVRLPNENTENIIYTTNDFRSGKINDWFWTMKNEIGTELGERFYVDLGAGLDCFLNDIKIHKYHNPQRNKFYKPIPLNVEKDLTSELEQYKNKFRFFGKRGAIELIENRYKDSIQKSTDFRYYHKVFYYDKYVLKFHYPCKASLDKKTFDSTIPTASKEQLLTILKTNDFLYENGIVPKLYHAGIYKGILYVIQERYSEESIIYNKYNFHPKWDNLFSWPSNLGLDVKLKEHFFKALENNILLTDLINVYNNAIDKDGNIKYFDLDGIKYFETKEEMINSDDYKNSIGIIKEIT